MLDRSERPAVHRRAAMPRRASTGHAPMAGAGSGSRSIAEPPAPVELPDRGRSCSLPVERSGRPDSGRRPQPARRGEPVGDPLAGARHVVVADVELADRQPRAPASRRSSSCSATNRPRSSYWSGLPDTVSRSARAASNVSGRRTSSATWKPSGASRSSSQPKSMSRPRSASWNAGPRGGTGRRSSCSSAGARRGGPRSRTSPSPAPRPRARSRSARGPTGTA